MSRVPRANTCPRCRRYWRLDGDCTSPGANLPRSIGCTEAQGQGTRAFVNDVLLRRWLENCPAGSFLIHTSKATPVLMDRHERGSRTSVATDNTRGGNIGCERGWPGASTGTGEGRQTIDRGHGGVPSQLPRQWYRDGVEHPPSRLRQGAARWWWELVFACVVCGRRSAVGGRPARLERGGIFIEAGCGLRACAPRVASCWACRVEMTAALLKS